MNKNQIITKVANDPMIKTIVFKYTNNKYLEEELFQELMVILLEYDEDKLIELYNNNELTYWICAIIRNQSISSSSSFFRKIKKYNSLINDNYSTDYKFNLTKYNDDYNNKELIFKNKKFIYEVEEYLVGLEKKQPHNLNVWYDNELFRMYYFGLPDKKPVVLPMSYREIQDFIKIPHCSIYHTIRIMYNKVVKHFKLRIKTFNK